MITQILTYSWSFMTVVVASCFQYDNYKACLPVWEWVPPYIADVQRLVDDGFYSNESGINPNLPPSL